MEISDFKFVQIGLGSMGKRRIRNLLFHGIKSDNIFGFDLSADRCKEVEEIFGVKTSTSLEEAELEFNPDVYIISTPPNKHSDYFLRAARKKKHFFVEVTTVDDGYDELYGLLDGSFVSAPSHTFRYFPAIKEIKKIVASGKLGKILSFQYHMGQYLPDWHPWEDYREVYFSKKETGACREMFPFELIWLTDVLNSKPSSVQGVVSSLSDLDMSADDYFASIVEFDSGIIGNIVIDVLSRYPFRTLRLVGENGILDWEWQDYKIRVYDSLKQEWESINLKKGENEKNYVTTEDMYREEMSVFLDAILDQKKYPYSFEEDHALLKTLFALEESNKDGSRKLLNKLG